MSADTSRRSSIPSKEPSGPIWDDISRAVTPDMAFRWYEDIRDRLPTAPSQTGALQHIPDLGEIADHADVFVFDAYGVLNTGKIPIPGAARRVSDLRAAGKSVFVLTNAASYAATQAREVFRDLGFDFTLEEIVSSRMVCERHLPHLPSGQSWGVAAPADWAGDEVDVPTLQLLDDIEVYDRAGGILFLSTLDWNSDRQAMLLDSLARNPRPVVVANPDLVAPRETCLTREPGFYSHDLQSRLGLKPQFHGKPFASVYREVERRSGAVDLRRIVMVGDTLHTDILGAQSHGWRSVLITNHGLFAGQRVQKYIDDSGLYPDWIAPNI
ncbi:HAD-IIA family hydrolase [Ruegeria sp. HKCCD4884]|uniref:HAD-IIA family hydrolase n=1 Tax=Ruegeria sp. HKCCD4884 TaxID=2683022 RepID=UPI0014925E94|nr:HAD-IIA family hydrolase [Ruegeria sp. HKCCD4884]NOD92856.1 HAD-IIA family hydrolase [Ruegeria sp. HKCCD4884]